MHAVYSYCWLRDTGGRTLVFDRRTLSVMCSTHYRQVITYVGKPSAVGQPTRPTQPFILSVSIMSSKLQLDVCDHNQWWCQLVNAYEVEAGMVLFAGKTV